MKKQVVITVGRHSAILPIRQFRSLVKQMPDMAGLDKVHAKLARLQLQLEKEKGEHEFYRRVFTTLWPRLNEVCESVHPVHIPISLQEAAPVQGVSQIVLRLKENELIKAHSVCSAEDQFDRKCGLGVCIWKIICRSAAKSPGLLLIKQACSKDIRQLHQLAARVGVAKKFDVETPTAAPEQPVAVPEPGSAYQPAKTEAVA